MLDKIDPPVQFIFLKSCRKWFNALILCWFCINKWFFQGSEKHNLFHILCDASICITRLAMTNAYTIDVWGIHWTGWTVVYGGIIDYIHMTRIITKRPGRILFTNRPVILKNQTKWFDSCFRIYYKYPPGYSYCIMYRPGNANWWPDYLNVRPGVLILDYKSIIQINIRSGIWNKHTSDYHFQPR